MFHINIIQKKKGLTYDELVKNVKDVLDEIPIHIYKNLIKGAYDRSVFLTIKNFTIFLIPIYFIIIKVIFNGRNFIVFCIMFSPVYYFEEKIKRCGFKSSRF